MASIDLIRASNGSGDAVKATVTNARVISSTTIQVDATTNWPSKFIATVGSVDGTGAFVPATVTVFNGTLSGGNIEITSFAPGYTDLGNTPGQVVVLKPTTAWANEVANTLAVAHNDSGTLKNDSVTTAAITDANVTTAKIANSAVTSGKIDFTTLGSKYSSSTTAVSLSGAWSAIESVVLDTPGAYLLIGQYQISGNGASVNPQASFAVTSGTAVSLATTTSNWNNAQGSNTWGMSMQASGVVVVNTPVTVALRGTSSPTRQTEGTHLLVAARIA